MRALFDVLPRAAAGLALAALCACHPPELVDSVPPEPVPAAPAFQPPPPPPPPQQQPEAPAETPLLGAPPAPPPSPEPTPPAEPLPPIAMAPIPNPPEPAPRVRRAPQFPAAPRETARAPEPQPAPPAAAPKPAPKAAPTPAPVPKAAPTPAPKPNPPRVLPPPDGSDHGPRVAPAAKSGSPIARLGQVLGAEVSGAARLEIPDGLPNGRTGVIVLALPDNFGQRLRQEAAKLGLSKDAQDADVRATLTADGYIINPTGPQLAEVTDQPIRFSWLVTEGTDVRIEKTPLRAEIVGELKGGATARSFPIASIGGVPAPLAQQPTAPRRGAALPAGVVALAVPLILILAALFILGRWARARREDKDRRRAALKEFHS